MTQELLLLLVTFLKVDYKELLVHVMNDIFNVI
jgi:hypothetical protein